MTYGENSGALRAELATLLRQHRIQQRLGGPGSHTIPESTTLEERASLGRQIARYRQSVLLWCLHAVRAAGPDTELGTSTARSRRPAEELRYRLTSATEPSPAGLPTLDELTTEHEFPMVETWRKAARAAALGEHDFAAGVTYTELSDAQCGAVLKDAAALTRGLVVLDRRYKNIPGWRTLTGQTLLGRAAEVCDRFAGDGEQDFTVDLRGWRPPEAVVDGPPPAGITGVLQAERNLLVHLSSVPNALNLRRILHSQRIVSHEAAGRAGDVAPVLAAKWVARAQIYSTLVRQTRDLSGVIGGGGAAAAQAAQAAARLRNLDCRDLPASRLLHHLDATFTRIDARIGDVIEHGIAGRLYLARVPLPRIDWQAAGLVKPVRTRHVHIDSTVQTDLVHLVRTQLRLRPTTPRSPADADPSRSALEAAITHRPNTPETVRL